MAKNEQDSFESANALTNDASSDATPYINDDAHASGRFAWIKTKPAKITAISVGGALAIGAVFAGGAFAGQVAEQNNGPSFGAQFEGGDQGGPGEHGGPQGFGNAHQSDDQVGGPTGDDSQLDDDSSQLNQDDGKYGDDDQGEDGDHEGRGHGPRPPHDFDDEGDDDRPQLGGLNGSTGLTPTAPQVQSN